MLRLAENIQLNRIERVVGVGVLSFSTRLGRRIQLILESTRKRVLTLSPRLRTSIAISILVGSITGAMIASSPEKTLAMQHLLSKSEDKSVASPRNHISHNITLADKPALRSNNMFKTRRSVIPALLALAGGAIQVNLPAVADPVAQAPIINGPALDKPDTSSSKTSIQIESRNTPDAMPGFTPPGVPSGSTMPGTPPGMREGNLTQSNNTSNATPALTPPGAPAGTTLGGPLPGTQNNAENSRTYSINFHNASAQVIFDKLFAAVGANYVVSNDASSIIISDINISNVSFMDALRTVCRAASPPLTFDYTDGVYHIKIKHVESGSEAANQKFDRRYYKLPIDNLGADEFLSHLRQYSLEGVLTLPAAAHIVAIKADNSLLIHATPDEYMEIREAVRNLDVEIRRVWIGVQIVNTTNEQLKNLGINSTSLVSGTTKSDINKLKAAIKKGTINVYSCPSITTQNGKTSNIAINGNTPAGLKSSAINIDLTITPTILANDRIVMDTIIKEDLLGKNANRRSYKVTGNVSSGNTTLLASTSIENNIQLILATATVQNEENNEPVTP